MTAPLALDFRAQFEHILESAKVELGILRVASGASHADFIILGGDFRSQMIVADEQVDDLLLIARERAATAGLRCKQREMG